MKDLQPPLPEPTEIYFGHYGFTESQLLAYRAEVIEMCAAECDRLEAEPIDIYASQCADAIRGKETISTHTTIRSLK